MTDKTETYSEAYPAGNATGTDILLVKKYLDMAEDRLNSMTAHLKDLDGWDCGANEVGHFPVVVIADLVKLGIITEPFRLAETGKWYSRLCMPVHIRKPKA